MARRDYVVEGAILECTLGTAPGEMVVTSQQKVKVKGKLKATSEDKMPKPPFFGSCTCSSPNPPCSPVFKEWQLTSKGSTMGSKTFLMANSQFQCEKGGLVTVKDVGQKLAGTGKKEPELDDKYAELKGEIIFANGYLSSSLGGALNALKDLNPDEPNPSLHAGWNANEHNPLDPDNILLDSELAVTDNMTDQEKEAEKKAKAAIQMPVQMSPVLPPVGYVHIDLPTEFKSVQEFTREEHKKVFWGYWNQIGNYHKGSQTYAEYFNAENNEHFLNGSHGLASNGAHRLDHGIAMGYHWAMYQWGIVAKEEVDDTKEKVPYIESYSPAYKPLTLVMHSQGNAPGVGFALGAMKYANELGWDRIPVNLIFLGVHQPQNLWEQDYEDFLKLKTQHYLADTDFWDTISGLEKNIFLLGGKAGKAGVLLKQYLSNKGDANILKYLNGISELFSTEHHKLRNKRGIYEHLKAITDFGAIKERSVQFTFSNDHADIVCRDGDIPEIDSACNPKRDTTLFSVEYFSKAVPEHYAKDQGKEIVSLSEGGFVVIPPYAAVPRLEAKEDETVVGGVKIVEWKDYRSIAIDWGNAMAKYKRLKKEYEVLTGRKMTLTEFFISPVYKKGKETVKEIQLKNAYRKVVYHYARIQIADLYAHFSPVEFIHNEKILQHDNFDDGLGSKNIWERIKKLGQDKFYRVEYDQKGKKSKKMSPEDKRKKAKQYVDDGKNQKKMIPTSIANTIYIQDVIDAYVNGNSIVAEKLYREPVRSDSEQQKVEELIKQFGLTREIRKLDKEKQMQKLLKQAHVEQDNTRVEVPKSTPKN